MTSQGGMHNLTTLIKRLEAATSRLEDIASSTSPPDGVKPGTNAAAVSRTASLNGDGPTPTQALHPQATQQSKAVSDPDLPPAIADFDTMIKDDLAPFSDLSSKLGGVIDEQAQHFAGMFRAQRNVLLVASKAKKPADNSPVFMEVFKDLMQGSEKVGAVRERNRKTPQDNHLAMVSDGSAIVFWSVQPGKPDEYVGDILGGARTYGNRVLTEHKSKNQVHVDWVTTFVKLCASLKSYIKQHHAGGLIWKANGVSAEDALKEVASQPTSNGTAAPSSASPAAGGPPPPPPLPPAFNAQDPTSHHASPSSSTNDMGAVFADLNRGESVTSGLRKVDKSQVNQRSSSLRAQAPAEALARSDSNSSRGISPTPNKKPNSMRAKKPPRKELDGTKWIVENYESESSPVVIDAEKQQSILVSRCKSTTLIINGKANAITIDGCSRVDLVVDTLVSAIDVINTSNFRVQVTGTLPSVQMDKVDGASVILGQSSLDTEVYTSKCSSVNVVLPPPNEAEDSTECPVPEQFRSYVKNGQLMTEIVKQEG